MRKIAFLGALLGITLLVGMINFLPSKEVNNYGDISNLEENQKVTINGVVMQENLYGNLLIINVNGIKLVCEGCEKGFMDKKVFVNGIVIDYEEEKEIEVLRINILN
ncbi:hypothetical protein AUJ84_01010 [Candidatus Pacearchaeota archaeon CG1_02_32_132]|nr:MAG: hypothetical protein AUJ84_01010 [Candidatus Pacearchaeota archaeon CG1_02_32_132]